MATYQPYTEFSNVSGGGFETDRPGSNDNGQNTNSVTTLTPVTIKQIVESRQNVQYGPFVSHGQELHHVCFVGVVRNITDHTSNIFLTLEDGTSQIEVRKWSDDTSDVAQANQEGASGTHSSQVAQQYKIGTYVKVFGALKEFGGKKNIQYAVIKSIESYNEVLAHHLETIKCHAIANRKMKSSVDGGENDTDGQSLFVNEQTNQGNRDEAPLQRILTFCREQCEGKDANSFAVPVPLISQTLNLEEEIVRNCCTTLIEQGFIYPTFDDDHFFAL